LAQPRPQFGGLHAAAFLIGAAICLFAATQPAVAAPAAEAQFVFGMVTLVRSDGSSVAVQRGTELDVGETIQTGADGRIHLRFTDGGFVSLTPNAGFRIDEYRYSGQPDGGDRITMQLLKGGLRTVTGAIGKASRAAYKMATLVATIGIRGTEYTLAYLPQGGLTGTVASGGIEVCNGAGCLDVDPGMSFQVIDLTTKPVLTKKAADLGAPPPGKSSKDKGDATKADTASGDKVKVARLAKSSLEEFPASADGVGNGNGNAFGNGNGHALRVGNAGGIGNGNGHALGVGSAIGVGNAGGIGNAFGNGNGHALGVGNPAQQLGGIVDVLINSTSPNANALVEPRLVVDSVLKGNLPGNGWGAGGNPNRGGSKK
jgi:hypothetical protein